MTVVIATYISGLFLRHIQFSNDVEANCEAYLFNFLPSNTTKFNGNILKLIKEELIN